MRGKLPTEARITVPSLTYGRRDVMESLSANNRADQSFHHRICKLRWIGDDDEAETLLRSERGKHDFVLPWPFEFATD